MMGRNVSVGKIAGLLINRIDKVDKASRSKDLHTAVNECDKRTGQIPTQQ